MDNYSALPRDHLHPHSPREFRLSPENTPVHLTTPASRYRGILFDLDGTLVDSVPDFAVAVDKTLVDLGLDPAGEPRVRNWVGNGPSKLIERALQFAGADVTATHRRALDLFTSHFDEDFISHSSLFHGVAEALPALVAKGCRLAICSNRSSHLIKPLLDHLHIGAFFSAWVGGDDLPVKKPHPAPWLHAAEKIAISPNDCLVVGDSINDVQSARSAGMTVAAVRYGYNYGEDISKSHPDLLIGSILELI
jgi:phosphoglycolate phosphatase